MYSYSLDYQSYEDYAFLTFVNEQKFSEEEMREILREAIKEYMKTDMYKITHSSPCTLDWGYVLISDEVIDFLKNEYGFKEFEYDVKLSFDDDDSPFEGMEDMIKPHECGYKNWNNQRCLLDK